MTTKAGEPVDKHYLTQVGRALKGLDVQMILAYSPQARRRSERCSGTWQGRLHQELRLAGLSTLEGANRFLREHHMDVFTRKFAVTPEQRASAFRRLGRSDLDWVSTPQTERMVANDRRPQLAAVCGSSIILVFLSPWLVARSPFTKTWMEACRCASARACGGGVWQLRPATHQSKSTGAP